jgi:hypothetical protein
MQTKKPYSIYIMTKDLAVCTTRLLLLLQLTAGVFELLNFIIV